MGKGERENVNTLCRKINTLMGALGKFPEIRDAPDAAAALALVREDFASWVARFVEGNPNA